MTEKNLKKQKPIGGFIKIHRKIFESDIFQDKPAFWFKLWVWMIGRARFNKGEKLDRGWLLTTYKEMADIASYKIGYRKQKPTKNQIDKFMRFLRRTQRSESTKTTRGVKIFIKNYAYYQDLGRYERTHEDANEDDKKTTDGRHDREEGIRIRKKDILVDKQPKEKELVPYKGKYSSLSSLTEADLIGIATKYRVPIALVKLCLEEMTNWCEAKGKTYKNYKSGLANWVLREAKKMMKEGRQNDNKRGIDARHI